MLKAKTFKCKAYAKVNLFLNVFNKSKDNLHNLRSLVCFIDLYDEIRISDTARYTSNFTPSTTAFTSDSNTKLLIHGEAGDPSGKVTRIHGTSLAWS